MGWFLAAIYVIGVVAFPYGMGRVYKSDGYDHVCGERVALAALVWPIATVILLLQRLYRWSVEAH